MRRINTGSLNKEKLVFLVSSLGVSVGLYFFLTSGPIPLVLSAASTREPGPEPFKDVELSQHKDVNLLVDGDRISPFEPYGRELQKLQQPKPAPVAVNNAPPPPPPPPADAPKTPKAFDQEDPVSELDYMGVTFVNGESRALLKPKNGDAPVLVALGEEVPHFKYTVQKIEPQAVWISDGDNRPFLLKDASYSEDGSGSDSSSSSSSSSSSKTKDSKSSSGSSSGSKTSSAGPSTSSTPATTTQPVQPMHKQKNKPMKQKRPGVGTAPGN
jgi:hypothetical protein